MKNKILTISIIFILLSFIFINNNVFAANISYTLENGTELSVPEFPKGNPVTYFLIYDTDSGWIKALVSYVEGSYFKIYNISTTYYWFACYDSNDNIIDYYCYGTDDRFNGWKDNYYYSSENSISKSTYANSNFLTSDNLYNSDGSIFFQLTPVTLAEALEKSNPTQVWKTQMKNVVVSLVVFLVGLVAFLKAWAWLKTQLHKA